MICYASSNSCTKLWNENNFRGCRRHGLWFNCCHNRRRNSLLISDGNYTRFFWRRECNHIGFYETGSLNCLHGWLSLGCVIVHTDSNMYLQTWFFSMEFSNFNLHKNSISHLHTYNSNIIQDEVSMGAKNSSGVNFGRFSVCHTI